MRIGAELGYALCQKEFSDVLFIAGDDANAVLYMRRAAVQGYKEAQRRLGNLYKHGREVEKNRMMALCLTRRAGWADDDYTLCYDLMSATLVRTSDSL